MTFLTGVGISWLIIGLVEMVDLNYPPIFVYTYVGIFNVAFLLALVMGEIYNTEEEK